MCAYRRRVWTEKELKRILAARADGLSIAEIAARFGCTGTMILGKLAELRARDAPRLVELRITQGGQLLLSQIAV